MDCYFMKLKPVLDAKRIPTSSVTCIAVKADKHENIMSSVALKKKLKNQGQVREWLDSSTCLVIVR